MHCCCTEMALVEPFLPVTIVKLRVADEPDVHSYLSSLTSLEVEVAAGAGLGAGGVATVELGVAAGGVQCVEGTVGADGRTGVTVAVDVDVRALTLALVAANVGGSGGGMSPGYLQLPSAFIVHEKLRTAGRQ
ncbi:MAG: hypothetical protein WCT54_04670 [Patescibacteria group bacterium]